jgi:hypothetical protein
MAAPVLTSALGGGEWSASCPCCFTCGERAPQYSLDRRLGGPQSQSGHYKVEKNLLPLLGIELSYQAPILYLLLLLKQRP